MLLTEVEVGGEVVLRAISGGKGVRSKLYSLGLLPGVVMRVLQPGGPGGPVVIAVRDDRLAIGRGMAEKMVVETLGAARP